MKGSRRDEPTGARRTTSSQQPSTPLAVVAPEPVEPIIPVGWRWLVGIYLGVPLLLVVLRPEILPDTPGAIARHYGVTVLATLGVGGVVHSAYAWLLPRLLPRIPSLPARLAVHAVTILGGVMVGKAFVRPLIHRWCAPNLRPNSARELLVAVVAAIVVVAVGTAYTQLRRRTERIEQLEAQARQAALSAQLEALQARTNPHFLFNSLNTVASLIPTDPKVAEETLERLSDLLRYTLQSARRASVRLADELEVVRGYLAIEQLRLGERLRYEIDVDPSLERLRVPPLMLQPLVENAILHGISCKRKGGDVIISAWRDKEFMVLRVRDEGSEATTHGHAGTGTALTDLERRIALTYGAEATIEQRKLDRGYMITLRIPLVTNQVSTRDARAEPGTSPMRLLGVEADESVGQPGVARLQLEEPV